MELHSRGTDMNWTRTWITQYTGPDLEFATWQIFIQLRVIIVDYDKFGSGVI